MFEELIRSMRRLDGPHRVSISVALDDKGYYDRLCPSPECGGYFKVLFDDWRDKVRDEVVYCPFCRHEAAATEWHTPEQQAHIKSAARAEMSRLVGKAISDGVRRSRPVQYDAGLFKLSMGLSFRPGTIPPVVAAKASDALRQDFTCEKCACRYASVGASFFCPACGYNSVVSSFDVTLETVQKAVASLDGVGRAIETAVDADAARNATRQILEDQFPRLVGAFERLSEALFERLPAASTIGKKGSIFQRIDDASLLWQQATGKGYADFLSASELGRLKLLTQQRHVLSHRQGIVDQAYIDRSGDLTYTVGQRLVIHEADVLELAKLLGQLALGLRGTSPAVP